MLSEYGHRAKYEINLTFSFSTVHYYVINNGSILVYICQSSRNGMSLIIVLLLLQVFLKQISSTMELTILNWETMCNQFHLSSQLLVMWRKIQVIQLKLHAILGLFKYTFNNIIFIMSEISYVHWYFNSLITLPITGNNSGYQSLYLIL